MVSTLMSFIECIGLHTVKSAENLFSIADCCKSVSVKDIKKKALGFLPRVFNLWFTKVPVFTSLCFVPHVLPRISLIKADV